MVDRDFINLVQKGSMKSGNNWGCGILLIHPDNGKLLLARRTDTHNFASPGGKVEIGESPMQGIVRECLEESNIGINSMVCYDSFMHTAENGKNWVSFMFMSNDFDYSNIRNQEREMEEFDWYSIPEALEMDLFPATRKSIERALELGILKLDGNVTFQETEENDGNGYFPKCSNCLSCYSPNPYYNDVEGSSYSYVPDMIDWL